MRRVVTPRSWLAAMLVSSLAVWNCANRMDVDGGEILGGATAGAGAGRGAQAGGHAGATVASEDGTGAGWTGQKAGASASGGAAGSRTTNAAGGRGGASGNGVSGPGNGSGASGASGPDNGSGGVNRGAGGAASGAGMRNAGGRLGGAGGRPGSGAGGGGDRDAGASGRAGGVGGRAAAAGGGPAGAGGRVSAMGGAATGNVGGAGGSTGGGSTGACGPATRNMHPFGCNFAWGIADPGGSLSAYSYLQFVSYWVDSSIKADGTYSTCNACSWLTSQVSKTNLIPTYYAYIIGFLAHANGIVDGNQSGSKKLTTDGAQLVRDHYDAIVAAYGWYARESYKAWPTKPLVWLLEGDFVQLADKGQSNPLTFAEVGRLAADVTCAIKSNMPNAVVAIDHSSWNSDDTTNQFWGAMASVNYDMVWTTGVGNNQGFIEASATSSTYNHATATYSYLHTLTQRPILVDTSAGASAAGDSWSTASAADLNARISEGVIAANITGTAPTGLESNVSRVKAGLNAIPSCP